jgi:multidrug resistance efflux pump
MIRNRPHSRVTAAAVAATVVILAAAAARPPRVRADGEVVDVVEREITVTCLANGVIEAPTQAKVAPVISGELIELALAEGHVVREGQVVARLDAAAIDAELEAATAAVRVAEASLARIRGGARPQEVNEARALVNKAKAAMDERKSDLDRYRALHEKQAAPLKELEAAQAQYDMAREEYQRAVQQAQIVEEGARHDDIEVARRKLDEARAAIKGIQTRKDKTVIRAPITGTVVRKLAYRGEIAMPGVPLLHLVNLEKLEAVLNVEETYVDGIHTGQSAEIFVDAVPARPFAGKVTYIAPVSSEQLKLSLLKEEEDTKRFHVKVQLEAGKARLRAGMSVKGRFAVPRRGIFVPRDAVELKAGLPIVRVTTGSSVIERSVRTGVREGDLVHVTAGLIGGEKLLAGRRSGRGGGYLTTP